MACVYQYGSVGPPTNMRSPPLLDTHTQNIYLPESDNSAAFTPVHKVGVSGNVAGVSATTYDRLPCALHMHFVPNIVVFALFMHGFLSSSSNVCIAASSEGLGGRDLDPGVYQPIQSRFADLFYIIRRENVSKTS